MLDLTQFTEEELERMEERAEHIIQNRKQRRRRSDETSADILSRTAFGID